MKLIDRSRQAITLTVCVTTIAGVTVTSATAAEGVRPPAAIYATTCGYCHDANVGPVILGKHLPPAAIEQFVRSGLNAMPAFRPTEITDAELHELSNWIQASAAVKEEEGK